MEPASCSLRHEVPWIIRQNLRRLREFAVIQSPHVARGVMREERIIIFRHHDHVRVSESSQRVEFRGE